MGMFHFIFQTVCYKVYASMMFKLEEEGGRGRTRYVYKWKRRRNIIKVADRFSIFKQLFSLLLECHNCLAKKMFYADATTICWTFYVFCWEIPRNSDSRKIYILHAYFCVLQHCRVDHVNFCVIYVSVV